VGWGRLDNWSQFQVKLGLEHSAQMHGGILHGLKMRVRMCHPFFWRSQFKIWDEKNKLVFLVKDQFVVRSIF
jgi:hypothetical protein